VKPTAEDFAPRRDGWFEHWGVWGEVTVGTVLADRNSRTKRWEIIAQAHGAQVEAGQTLWMRAREQTSGEEFSVQPHSKVARVRILTQSPHDTQTAPPTEPSDTEAIALVVEKLGASHLATRDSVTGEITCPDYLYQSHIPGHGDRQIQRGLIEHLLFAHNHPVASDISLEDLITVHGQAHSPKHPGVGKGGFPHRHVPEDMAIMTGKN